MHLLNLIIFILAFPIFAAPPSPTFVVEVIEAKEEPFSFKRRYIGTITSEYFSLLRPDSIGTIDEINVKPEQAVKKGQRLFSLDNAAQRSLVDLDEKHLNLSKRSLKRYEELRKTDDISTAQLEKALIDVLHAEQKLAQDRKALTSTEVRAPFDGIAGVPRVVLGQTVSPKDSLISIRKGLFSVSFRVPASRLKEIAVGEPILVNKETAKIDAVERSIDPLTRTGFAKATLKECPRCIVGSSTFVEVTVSDKANAILLPNTAIYYSEGEPHVVLVVKNPQGELIAQEQKVSVGHEQKGMVEILSGVKNGDMIVKINPKRLPKSAKLKVAS
jgi:membrane fusion protein (multidrug efflux system)